MDPHTHHTYGSPCRLAAVVEPEPDNALLQGIPPIRAQYFYSSLIPIDDPLSTATVPASSDSNASRSALRPFSQADSNALERAWLSLASDSLRSSHHASLADPRLSASLAATNSAKVQAIVDSLLSKHQKKHAQDRSPALVEAPSNSLANAATPVCCQTLLIDASNALRENFCQVTRRKQKDLGQENVIQRVMAAMEKDRPKPIVVPPRVAPSMSSSSPRTEAFVAPGLSTSTRGRAPSLSKPPESRAGSTDPRPTRHPMSSTPVTDKFLLKPAPVPVRPPVIDDGISGKPLLNVEESKAEASLQTDLATTEAPLPAISKHERVKEDRGDCPSTEDGKENSVTGPRAVEVPVGISRLHLTSLPALQMKPLYWSPVNDMAIVTRATWFYR